MKKQTLLVLIMANLIGMQVFSQCLSSYCAIGSNSTAFEFIREVTIGPLNNLSGDNGGYADFGSSFPATYTAGSSYSYSVRPGYPDGPFSLSWVAWMDFNQDGDFDDPGEEIFTDFGQFTLGGGFSIPSTAVNGDTKLRIGVRFGSFPASCGIYADGDFEDYCVTITGGVSPCDVSTPVTGLSSTVGATTVTLQWNAVPGSVGCQISGGPVPNFDNSVRRVGSEVNSAVIPLAPLPPGNYNWYVSCACDLTPPVVGSPPSAADFFTVPAPRLSAGTAKIAVSPNPADGHLNVRLVAEAAGEYQLSVFDLLGRQLFSEKQGVAAGENNLSISLDKLDAGTYLLLSEDGSGQKSQQTFVKN